MLEGCFFRSRVVSLLQELCWSSGDVQTLQPWPSADPVAPAGAMDKEQQFLEGEGKGNRLFPWEKQG